jgi:hypothetical protein
MYDCFLTTVSTIVGSECMEEAALQIHCASKEKVLPSSRLASGERSATSVGDV